MQRAHLDNDLLIAAYAGLSLLAKICACFAVGAAIGAVWYLCAAFRAGVL